MLTIQEILEQDNLLNILDDEAVKDIQNSVIQGYKADRDSRSEWESNVDKWTVLASQVMEAKNTPWQNASNIKYPLVTEAAIQFSSKMYPAIVTGNSPAKGRVLGEDPTGEKLNRATRISKHMSYQLLERIEEWEEVHDKASMITGVVGCCFKKMYYCPVRKRPVSQFVHPKQFVVNYYTQSLSDCRRYTHDTELYGSDIVAMQRLGLFSDVDLRSPEQKNNELKNKTQGVQAPAVDSATPYDIGEQMAYFDLDEDGYEEPYLVVFEKTSQELLRVVACYSEDSVQMNDAGEVYHIQRENYFTKYGLLPAPDGSFYDYGFGQYIGPLNYALNTIFNQLIDAGSLAVRGGGFIAKGIRVKGGQTTVKMGEWQAINATGEDLRKGIFPYPIKEPSPTLLNLATYLITAGQRLAGTIDSQVGENPGQNQKATTTALVMEAGQKVFGGVYKRFLRSFKEELRILRRLNKDNLDFKEYFIVLDSQLPEEVLRADYEDSDLDIVPSADPSYTNEQQKLQKATLMLEMANMGLGNRQIAAQAMADAQEIPNKEQFLDVPPPPPSIEERELEDTSMREWTKVKVDTILKMAQAKGINAKAMRDIAEAEAVEPGRQADIYKTILEYLDRDVQRELDSQLVNKGANSGQTETVGKT